MLKMKPKAHYMMCFGFCPILVAQLWLRKKPFNASKLFIFSLPPLGKNTEHAFIRWSRQPSLYLKSLYTDKTHRGRKERKSLPRLGSFATTRNTVFTDEVMQFALRGQQSERYPGLVRGGWSTEIGPKPRTNYICTAVYMKPTESFYF